MTTFGIRKFNVVLAAGVTAAALLTVADGPVARANEESWGAIAVGIDPYGPRMGVSKDMPNEMAANNAANLNCGQGSSTCNVMISFKYPDCGAVVKTEDQYYRDLGASQQDAEQNAISQSPKQTTKVLRSLCNDPPAGR